MTNVRVSDEDRSAFVQQPGKSGGGAGPASDVKGCPPTLALADIKKDSGKMAGGGGIQEFGKGSRVACLGGGMKGGDESVVERMGSEGTEMRCSHLEAPTASACTSASYHPLPLHLLAAFRHEALIVGHGLCVESCFRLPCSLALLLISPSGFRRHCRWHNFCNTACMILWGCRARGGRD